jgi:hypothetical protein
MAPKYVTEIARTNYLTPNLRFLKIKINSNKNVLKTTIALA